VTEDEAKTKWCPFARVGTSAYTGYPAVNRDVEGGARTEEASRCVGSACMAWRLQNRDSAGFPIPSERAGYCGLAGGSR